MPELSVVIATLKPREEIEVIEYLERDEFADYEVIVRNDENVNAARNEGIRRAAAEKILFLDDDSRPRRGYLTRAARTLDAEPVVAGRIVHPRNDVFARHFTNHYDRGDSPTYVNYFWGCNMGVRKEVFDAVGTWNERMGWGHEEKELADRIRREYRIYYDPEMVVEHPYADSIPDYWRKQFRLERKTPYYWNRKGLSTRQQVLRTLGDLCDPRNYLGRTATCAVTRAGGTLAKAAGRVRGLIERGRSGRGERSPRSGGDLS